MQEARPKGCVVSCAARTLTRAEYMQICRAVGMGFVVMGFIGYLVKLVHIPINNIVRKPDS